MREIIIYQSGCPKQGSISLTQKRMLGKLTGQMLTSIGLTCLIITAGPLMMLESKWQIWKLFHRDQTSAVIDQSGFSKVIKESDIEVFKPVDEQFTLIIPKIRLNSRVFADVQANSQKEYDKYLQNGIAHAEGSSLPGEGGTVFLFGHSTDFSWNIAKFNAVFYLLKELEPKDTIYVFYQGERHNYEVTEKKIVAANNVKSLARNDGESLILQTCWPPGTTWNRLLVYAKPLNI